VANGPLEGGLQLRKMPTHTFCTNFRKQYVIWRSSRSTEEKMTNALATERRSYGHCPSLNS